MECVKSQILKHSQIRIIWGDCLNLQTLNVQDLLLGHLINGKYISIIGNWLYFLKFFQKNIKNLQCRM